MNAALASAVDRTRAATAEVRGQRAKNHGVRAVLVVFQRPLLNGAVDQAKIINTSVLARRFASFDEVRNRNSGQETDNRDNDHDFNEREARLA